MPTRGGRVHRPEATFYIPDVFVFPLAQAEGFKDRDDVLEVYDRPLPLVVEIWSRSTADYDVTAKLADYRRYASLEGALALFCGWTGIDLGKYGDEEELRHVESNAVRSTVAAYAKFSPGTGKWTKNTVAEHISLGGNGPIIVGTPKQVADGLEIWIDEADVERAIPDAVCGLQRG